MSTTVTFWVVTPEGKQGRKVGDATLQDDGTLSYSSGAVESIMSGLAARNGPDKAYAMYADWSNGYLMSKQTDPAPAVTAAGGQMVDRWRGLLAPFGLMSGDRRKFAKDGEWDFRDLPRPASYQRADAPGHDGAVTVGRITKMKVTEAGFEGDGDWIDAMPETAEAKGLLRAGVLYPSVDLSDFAYELQTEDGRKLEELTDEEFETMMMSGEEPIMVFTGGKVGKVTFLAFEAFPQTTLELYQGKATPEPAVTASGAPKAKVNAADLFGAKPYPPEAWFADPELTELTPITVTPEGRVFGHLADRDCHMSYVSNGVCTMPPEGGFSWFHRGEIETEAGTFVSVGTVTTGTGHPSLFADGATAVEHYDNTGTQAAWVRAGRDQFGTWIAGTLTPDATHGQVQKLRASPLSGDWRLIGGKHQLVHALAVNMPGFPVVRGRVSSGRMSAITASGWTGWHSSTGDSQPATPERATIQQMIRDEFAQRAAVERNRAVAARIADSIGRGDDVRLAELDQLVHPTGR